MPIVLDGTAGIDNDATDLSYTGTLTGGTGVVNLGSGQFFKDASGNVGIGTSSPNAAMEIARAANPSGFSATGIRFVRSNYGGEVNGYINQGVGYGMIFSTVDNGNATERMRIDSSGNFMVGTTSILGGVNAKIHLYSADLANIDNTCTMKNGANNSGGSYIRFINYADTTIGSITQSSSTSVAYNTSSDYRLKENVVGVTGAAARVQQLNPVRFNFIADPDTTVDGFLAHEVQDVVPEAITGIKDATEMVDVYDEDGNVTGQEERPVYQGIDQSKLVPLLTAALQEALTKIDSLETRIAALEAA